MTQLSRRCDKALAGADGAALGAVRGGTFQVRKPKPPFALRVSAAARTLRGEMKMALKIALLVPLLFALGCTSAGTYPTKGDELPEGAAFSEVAVEIDKSLSATQLGTFRQFRGSHILRSAIVAALERQGRFDPNADHHLEVRVVGYRLKSGWEGVLNALALGGGDLLFGGYFSDQEDYLTVDVSVSRNEEDVLQTGASSASNRGGLVYFSGTGRLTNLSNALANVLTAEI
jgi:hypothetical protein